jgi:hypothetical protein
VPGFWALKKQGLRVSLLLICTFLFLFGLEFFGSGISTKTYDSKPNLDYALCEKDMQALLSKKVIHFPQACPHCL